MPNHGRPVALIIAGERARMAIEARIIPLRLVVYGGPTLAETTPHADVIITDDLTTAQRMSRGDVPVIIVGNVDQPPQDVIVIPIQESWRLSETVSKALREEIIVTIDNEPLP